MITRGIRALAIFGVLTGLLCCERPPERRAPLDRPATANAPESTDEPLVYLTELATNPRDRRVAVLLHGYGSNEHDLIPLARSLGLHGPIESYVAPLEVSRGHAWFPIDWESGSTRYAPDAADEVVVRLAESLREVREIHAGHELVVVGFSQGAMLTMMLAAEHPEVLDRGIALSGALPRPVVAKTNTELPPVFIAHGAADEVIPLERSTGEAENLRQAGVPVTARTFDHLGHGTSPQVIAAARRWLTTMSPAHQEL